MQVANKVSLKTNKVASNLVARVKVSNVCEYEAFEKTSVAIKVLDLLFCKKKWNCSVVSCHVCQNRYVKTLRLNDVIEQWVVDSKHDLCTLHIPVGV